ncbi:DUF924 family protein [Psychromonas ossibalaenae]|uniref:DUF924 family protein n=1 Tax=Psychromonas ossibalaenae TaxID=444922 RepID=UPI00036CB469|nr:DUF924 family protein [Psychromonas ossibalaenae]
MFDDVLQFWFEETAPAQWWTKDPLFDQLITNKFTALHKQAGAGELFEWRDTASGRLAEIIVLDQFSRNMFRDSARAFAQDALALVLAQEAISRGADKELNAVQRSFLYMPFMHSESLKIHQQAVILFKANGIQANYDFELKHKQVIEQFGRYPHRNKILKRLSSKQEAAFLLLPGSSF